VETRAGIVSPICPSCGAPLPAGPGTCPTLPRPGDDGRPRCRRTRPARCTSRACNRLVRRCAGGALLLVLSGLTALFGILLFALGRWPAGLIGLGLALPSLAAFAEAAKRKPDPRLGAPTPTAPSARRGSGSASPSGRPPRARARSASSSAFSGYAGEDDRPGGGRARKRRRRGCPVGRRDRRARRVRRGEESRVAGDRPPHGREHPQRADVGAQETMAREAPAGPETVE
jgi:hypothetical protein